MLFVAFGIVSPLIGMEQGVQPQPEVEIVSEVTQLRSDVVYTLTNRRSHLFGDDTIEKISWDSRTNTLSYNVFEKVGFGTKMLFSKAFSALCPLASVQFVRSIKSFYIDGASGLRSVFTYNENYDFSKYVFIDFNTNSFFVYEKSICLGKVLFTAKCIETVYLSSNRELVYVRFVGDQKKYVYNLHNTKEHVSVDCANNSVHVYNVEGKEVYKRAFAKNPVKFVKAAYITADGKTLFVFFKDGWMSKISVTKRFSDYSGRKKRIKTKIETPAGYMFSENRMSLAVNFSDRIDLYSFTKGFRFVGSCKKESATRGFHFSSDGRCFCLESTGANLWGNKLQIVDLTTGECIYSVSHIQPIRALTPDMLRVKPYIGEKYTLNLVQK